MMRLIVCAPVGVQRAEREVAGLGDAQRRLHRLQVTHLADQHDVRVLAQRRAQRVGEALRVAVHLALVDQAPLVLVHELDRVLDGEDVVVPLLVDLVDHRRQCRRLARPSAGDEDLPRASPASVASPPQVELGKPRSSPDEPERRRRAALVNMFSEARQPLDAEGEVELERLLKRFFCASVSTL